MMIQVASQPITFSAEQTALHDARFLVRSDVINHAERFALMAG